MPDAIFHAPPSRRSVNRFASAPLDASVPVRPEMSIVYLREIALDDDSVVFERIGHVGDLAEGSVQHRRDGGVVDVVVRLLRCPRLEKRIW